MLRKSLVSVLVLLVAVLACGPILMAQGKAKGLSKALSKAGGKGGANSALNRAGQNASRVGGSLSRANGLGHTGAAGGNALGSSHGLAAAPGTGATPGASDAVPPVNQTARHQKQLTIEQTNRDRRIAQAQHLREIAARNGDTELAANADRMEAFANDHYRARAEQLSRFGVTDPNLTDPNSPADPNLPTDPSAPQPAPSEPAPTPTP